MTPSRVLVVVAHPDDEILGCGGTIARLIKEGSEVCTLILGEGITSRDQKRDNKRRDNEITELKKQARQANRILGVKEVFFSSLPDNRFDTVPFLDIVKAIENIIRKVKPQIIFTHCAKDLNIDHCIIYKAVITAARPTPRNIATDIYSFGIISSTEWNFPNVFSPDTFFDINDTLNLKIKAMSLYKSELKKFPHPRSLKGIRINAEYWGIKVGIKYAEAFEAVRCIK